MNQAERIIIVAQTLNRVIGRDNAMPWHLPRDLAFFKQTTLGFPIIMGRKTYQSLGRALPQRQNIVISRAPSEHFPDALVYQDLTQALNQADHLANKVYIIGGAQLYQSAIHLVDTLLVTWIDTTLDGDSFFPEIDNGIWQETHKRLVQKDADNPFNLTFSTYKRR